MLPLLEQLKPWTRDRVKLLQFPYFLRPFTPQAINPTTPTHEHSVLSPVSLASIDQDGGPVDIYDLSEKLVTVNSLKRSWLFSFGFKKVMLSRETTIYTETKEVTWLINKRMRKKEIRSNFWRKQILFWELQEEILY